MTRQTASDYGALNIVENDYVHPCWAFEVLRGLPIKHRIRPIPIEREGGGGEGFTVSRGKCSISHTKTSPEAGVALPPSTKKGCARSGPPNRQGSQ